MCFFVGKTPVTADGRRAKVCGDTGAIGREFDFTYALNWLVRKSPGVEPLPAVSANGFDISKGWDPSLRSTNEGQAYLGTLHNYFVKLDPDGSLLITGVPPGDYELALHLYEPPDG